MKHEPNPVTESIRILSALPLLGHPRDAKRVTMLQSAGFEVEAVAFKRKYHDGRNPHCAVQILGEIEHGRYFARSFKMLRALPSLRQAMKRNDVMYASGADMGLMCLIAGLGLGKPVVVEIGDIREVQLARGLKGRIVRAIDRRLADACRLLVVTAPRFLDVYYRKWLGTQTPGLVIENKLESSFVDNVKSNADQAAVEGVPLIDRPLRIGYFGLLRDLWSWQVLEEVARMLPTRIEIVIAGLPMNPANLLKQVELHPNIQYRGQYRSPGDLPSLYNSVDMVWACYPPIRPDDWNLRWARPNRFYESCLFQKPTFTRAGSQDAVDVERFGIGMIIDENEVRDVVNRLSRILPEDVARWQQNMSTLPREVYAYSSEADELRDALVDVALNGCCQCYVTSETGVMQ